MCCVPFVFPPTASYGLTHWKSVLTGRSTKGKKGEAFDKMPERGRMNDRRLHLTPMRTESFFILPHEENFQDPFWLF
ncbi:unnamed protein product [Prunus armeniaca]|uniref:Uncharacterized protein n=1 Tax=Prunus armeniaca TaxID=36596 RepID=A0A6J5XEM5_PRUAR|nr:unnamed protein product [Prunus armeniaca]